MNYDGETVSPHANMFDDLPEGPLNLTNEISRLKRELREASDDRNKTRYELTNERMINALVRSERDAARQDANQLYDTLLLIQNACGPFRSATIALAAHEKAVTP